MMTLQRLIQDLKNFLKKLNNIEVEGGDILDYYINNAIDVVTNDRRFGIFNSTIYEIEFKGYKKLTTKPDDYEAIDKTKKFEINIKNSKGKNTIYYFVKEEAK